MRVIVEGRDHEVNFSATAAVTDSNGQYKIIDLRPGDYTVSFTLPGFNTSEYVLMDLGATVCLRSRPRTGQCSG